MRLGRLLVLAILVLIAGRTASSQEIKNDNSVTQRSSTQTFAAANDFGIRVAAKSGSGEFASKGPEYADGVCFTMHTIRVAREDGTDATRVISQSTCTPAVKLQMKSADARPTQPK